MATFIKAKTTLILKIEAASGTYGAPANSDFDIGFYEIEWDPEIEYWANIFASGRHSIGPGVMGKRKISFSAKFALRAGAALGTAPKWGKVAKIAGQTETIVASTSVAYTPDATKDEGTGVTASANIILVPTSGNAVLVSAKGCMCNMQVMMDDLGQPYAAKADFIGALNAIADGSVLTLTSPDTSIPPAVIGSATTVAGTAVQIGKFNMDFGNPLDLDYDGADAAGTGYAAAYVSGLRTPKITIDPKIKLLASQPDYTRWLAGTEVALSFASAVVSGQKIVIAAPKAQLKTNKSGNRNGQEIWQQEYELHENAGNDAHSITISA